MIINLGCASVDNHIPWDDISDYHPIRERNIYILFPICFCQRETFAIFFTNLINSKLISDLVSSNKTVFCVLMQHKYDESDKHDNLFCACAIANSVNKALNTLRNITQTSKETNCWRFDESLAGCLENVINL